MGGGSHLKHSVCTAECTPEGLCRRRPDPPDKPAHLAGRLAAVTPPPMGLHRRGGSILGNLREFRATTPPSLSLCPPPLSRRPRQPAAPCVPRPRRGCVSLAPPSRRCRRARLRPARRLGVRMRARRSRARQPGAAAPRLGGRFAPWPPGVFGSREVGQVAGGVPHPTRQRRCAGLAVLRPVLLPPPPSPPPSPRPPVTCGSGRRVLRRGAVLAGAHGEARPPPRPRLSCRSRRARGSPPSLPPLLSPTPPPLVAPLPASARLCPPWSPVRGGHLPAL